MRDGQTSPHKPRLVVPHSTCPSLSPSPPAHSFIIGPAVINTHTLSSARPFSNGIFRSDGAPCARPLLPSSDRSAGQRNQPSHSTVLARPVCLFVCVSAASFPCRFPDERTPIEATPLSATSTELGLGWGLGLGLDSLSHSSSHALSFFSPPSFHTLSLSPVFTSVWWSA